MGPATSPVPQDVADELRRVVQRWQQLPLDHALSCLPAVRVLLADLAEQDAPGHAVPDLGPAVVMDQVSVLVYDVCAKGCGPAGSAGLAKRLRGLLASLA